MDDRKFARYAFLLVVMVAVVGMLSAGGQNAAVGEASGVISPAALEAALDKCVPARLDMAGGDEAKAAKYCECIYFYGGKEDCDQHLE